MSHFHARHSVASPPTSDRACSMTDVDESGLSRRRLIPTALAGDSRGIPLRIFAVIHCHRKMGFRWQWRSHGRTLSARGGLQRRRRMEGGAADVGDRAGDGGDGPQAPETCGLWTARTAIRALNGRTWAPLQRRRAGGAVGPPLGRAVAAAERSEQKAELAQMVREGPDPATDGVVRWRRVDLQRKIEARFTGQDARADRGQGHVRQGWDFRRLSVRRSAGKTGPHPVS